MICERAGLAAGSFEQWAEWSGRCGACRSDSRHVSGLGWQLNLVDNGAGCALCKAVGCVYQLMSQTLTEQSEGGDGEVTVVHRCVSVRSDQHRRSSTAAVTATGSIAAYTTAAKPLTTRLWRRKQTTASAAAAITLTCGWAPCSDIRRGSVRAQEQRFSDHASLWGAGQQGAGAGCLAGGGCKCLEAAGACR